MHWNIWNTLKQAQRSTEMYLNLKQLYISPRFIGHTAVYSFYCNGQFWQQAVPLTGSECGSYWWFRCAQSHGLQLQTPSLIFPLQWASARNRTTASIITFHMQAASCNMKWNMKIQCIQKVFRPLHFFHILLCCILILKLFKCRFSSIYTQ